MQASERAELIRQYEDGVPTFTKALAGVPAGALKWRPAPGAWSVHEIVCHCADSETNSASRIRYLTGERDLSLDNYDQDRWAIDFDYHAHPLESAPAVVEAVRANTAPLIRRLPEEAWQRTHHHKTTAATRRRTGCARMPSICTSTRGRSTTTWPPGARARRRLPREESELAQVSAHAGMDQLGARRRRSGVGRGRFLSLSEPLHDAGFRLVQRLCHAVGGVVAQARARHDERPGAERLDRRVRPRIGPRRP